MWVVISRVILKNRLLLSFLILLSTAFMVYKSFDLQISYKMINMLPDKAKANVEYDNFISTFGEDANVIVIAVEDTNLYKLDKFNKWHDLAINLSEINIKDGDENKKGVEQVFSISKSFLLNRNDSLQKFVISPIFKDKAVSQKQLDSLIKVLHNTPFYENSLYKKNSSLTTMVAYLNENVLESKLRKKLFVKFTTLLDDFEEQTAIHTRISGLPYIRIVSTSLISKEMNLFIILSLVIICSLLLLFFKSFKIMFFSLLVVSIGVVWSLAITVILGYEITLVTATIAPLILVIGVPNCVFFVNKYYVEYERYKNVMVALSSVIQKMGRSIFLTNFTTALGFFAFVFIGNKELTEYGIVSSLSVMALFLLSLLSIPIIYSFLPAPKEKHVKHLNAKWINAIVNKSEHIVLNKRKQVYLFFALIILISIGGIFFLKTSGRISEDLPRANRIVEDLSFFDKAFSGVLPFEITVNTKEKNGLFKDNAKALYKIKKFQRKLKKVEMLSQPISIIDAVKFSYQAYKGGRKKFYNFPPPTQLQKIKPFLPSDSTNNLQQISAFVDSSFSTARISYRIKDLDIDQMDTLVSKVEEVKSAVFKDEDYTISLTGKSFVFLAGTRYLTHNLFISILIAILLIGMFMATLFSSWQMVVISITPNIIPLIMVAGAMGYFGIHIKPSTILIFSIVFGIAVDDSIHFLSKFKQEYKNHPAQMGKAVTNALRETSYSMTYTSIILFCGFSVFLISNFGGTTALGILLPMTIIFAILCDLILLPSLLMSFDKLVILKAMRKEPLIDIINEEVDIDIESLRIKK